MFTQSITLTCLDCERVYTLINCRLKPTHIEDVSAIVCPSESHWLGTQTIIENHGAVTLLYDVPGPAQIATIVHMAHDL